MNTSSSAQPGSPYRNRKQNRFHADREAERAEEQFRRLAVPQALMMQAGIQVSTIARPGSVHLQQDEPQYSVITSFDTSAHAYVCTAYFPMTFHTDDLGALLSLANGRNAHNSFARVLVQSEGDQARICAETLLIARAGVSEAQLLAFFGASQRAFRDVAAHIEELTDGVKAAK